MKSYRGCYLVILFLVASTYGTAQPKKFTVLTYNILNGLEQQQTKKDQLVEWVKKVNPDLIAFQELNHFTQASLEEFARAYGHSYAVLLKEQGSPVGITSKYPIRDLRKVVEGMHHGLIYARVRDYHVLVTHLAPSIKAFAKRQMEIKKVLNEVAGLPAKEKVMILGDFNAFSIRDSLLYNAIPNSDVNGTMTFDYTVTGNMESAGFIDALRMKYSEPVTSFPTQAYETKNPNSQCRLDYIWLSKSLSNYCLNTTVVKDEFTDYLSDHYPVLAEFRK